MLGIKLGGDKLFEEGADNLNKLSKTFNEKIWRSE